MQQQIKQYEGELQKANKQLEAATKQADVFKERDIALKELVGKVS